jgi:hypothetical protein
MESRGAKMSAKETGIATGGLRKGILGTFGSVLHIRWGRRALLRCLVLKGQGPLTEQHHTEAVEEHLQNRVQILAFLCHTVIYRPVKCPIVKLLQAATLGVLHEGLDHIFGNIPDGHQTVYTIYK